MVVLIFTVSISESKVYGHIARKFCSLSNWNNMEVFSEFKVVRGEFTVFN